MQGGSLLNAMLSRSFAIAFALVLSGCIPGQYMSVKGPGKHQLIQGGEVDVVPITADLVAADSPMAQLPPELLNYQPEEYRIHPGDTLIITVWDHPELT